MVRYDELEGRRVLVTGASSGIGRGIAEAFLAQGARVAVHFLRQREAAHEVVARAPERAFAVGGELSDDASARRVVDEAAAHLGGLDVLVHSAGIWEPGPIAELDAAKLERMFRVNTFSAFYLARDAARVMERGSLILIGSTAGQRGEPRHSPYAASKAALRALVMSLAQELGPRIRPNLISPGWVRTPMVAATLPPETERRVTAHIPDGRLGEVSDCAAAALFLASDGGSHLVGTELEVSGGALLPIPAR